MYNKFRNTSAIMGLIGALGVSTVDAQQNVQVTSYDLGHGVYMLTGAGGNLGASVGEDGIILVDDQYAPLTDKIVEALKELSDQDVRYVINTHWHGDHTGGNENLGKMGTVIVSHDNVYERLSVDSISGIDGSTVRALPKVGQPTITFDSELSFRINGDNARAMHVPHGHTDGDSMIYFSNANVLHMGDLFFNGLYPFIDVTSGGTIDGLLAGIHRALETGDDNTKIIPGHGPLASKQDLAAYGMMLKTVRDRVAAQKSMGASLDDTLAAGLTAEYDADWTWNFINAQRLVTAIYRSLP